MSKKAIAIDEPMESEVPKPDSPTVNPKKKRRKCCTCCLAFLIALLVILAAAFGVGWYFGDKFTRENLDMSLADSLGVVNGLYWTKDKDVVTNPFDSDDLDEFYSEIKSNILLKTDADIDFSSALETAILQFSSSEADAETVARRNAAGVEAAATVGGSVTDALVGMLVNVFTRDNIDIERLRDYTPENDEYIFDLRDKELAAFIDAVLKLVLESGSVDAIGSYADMVDLAKVVALKQIRFKVASQTNELGENVLAATTADVTVWVGCQDAAGQAITYFLNQSGFGWAAGLGRWLANVFLPKNIYATVTVPLYGDAPAQITINKMTDTKRERAYKFVNGIMRMTSRENATTVQSLLGGAVDKIEPYMEAATKSMDFSAAGQGSVKLDLIGTMAEVASAALSEPIEKADFMYTLQALLTTDAEARLLQLRPYLYDKWYETESGKLEYDPSDKSGKTLIDYENEFKEEIERKYAVDFGEDTTLSEIFEMLGFDFGGETQVDVDLIEQIDAVRLHAALDMTDEQLKLRVTDRMLAAAMKTQVHKFLTSSYEISGVELDLDALTFVTKDGSDHTFALMAVEVDIAGMLGDLVGDSMLGKLAANILPEKLLLSVTVDITLSLAAGETYDETEFMFNDYENTDRVLATLAKLLPSLDLADLSDGIGEQLRDMLLQLDEKLGIEFVTSLVTDEAVTNGELVLPDVFKLMTDTILTDDDGNAAVTPEELKRVLYGLDNNDDVAGKDGNVAESYDGFLAEVVDMYYLDSPEPITTFDELTEFISDGSDGFSAEKFRVNDPEPDSLIYDKRAAAVLRPLMTVPEIGALVNENMSDNENLKGFRLTDTNIVVREQGEEEFYDLVIVVAVDVKELFPGNMSNLLTVDEIYVTVTVENLNNALDGEYPVTIVVNTMGDEDYESMLKIARHFGSSFDVEAQAAEFGKILYDEINSLEESLGEGFIEFTEDGLRLKSFYAYLASKLDLDKDDDGNNVEVDPEHVKEAIQGLYAKDTDVEPDNIYNFVYNEIVMYPSEVKEYENYNKLFAFTDESITDVDIDFNGFFDQAMVAGGMNSDVTAIQTVILAKGDDRDGATAMRGFINDRLDDPIVTIDKDFIVVTFDFKINKDDEDTANDFMPDNMYVMLVLEKVREGDKDVFIERGQVFNGVSADARKIMLKLMNLSDDSTDDGKINVHSVVAQSLAVLNGKTTEDGYTPGVADTRDITFGICEDGSGVGTITFTSKPSIIG